MRTRTVPVEQLPEISGEPWVDSSRRPYVKDGVAWVPVKDGFSADGELPERSPYRGRGYQMIGDIAVVHGKAPADEELAGIIAWKNPRAVLHVEAYEGVKRLPRVTILSGEPCDVCHHEGGHSYWIDPSRVMFAQGNRDEKARIAALIKNSGKDERVADMFAGIGYFTIPAACSGARVHAMEVNPVSFEYLKRNIRENGVEKQVYAEEGDCRELLSGSYDRVLMGHFDAPSMLEDVLSHVHAGSILHVHSIDPAVTKIMDAVKDAGFQAEIREHRVKKYSPGRWHMVQDVILS